MGTPDSSFLVNDKLRDDTTLDVGIEGSLGIVHILHQIVHHGLRPARELRHLLHHVEGAFTFIGCERAYCFNGRKGAFSLILLHFAFHRDDVALLHHLDLLATHLDGASLLTFLHGLLLLRFVVDIMGFGLGVEYQSHAHDGDEGKELQQTGSV